MTELDDQGKKTIVAIIAAIIIIVGSLLWSVVDPEDSFFTPYTKENQAQYADYCQRGDSDCDYISCDYVPDGKTVDEVCGTGFEEGLYPTGLDETEPLTP